MIALVRVKLVCGTGVFLLACSAAQRCIHLMQLTVGSSTAAVDVLLVLMSLLTMTS
jgi:hypothetical protein